MFEEMALSIGELLVILFCLILLFVIVYGAIFVKTSRYQECNCLFFSLITFIEMKNLSTSPLLVRELDALVV